MRRRALGTAVEVAVPLAVVAAIWVWTNSSDVYYYPPLSDVLDTFRRTWLFDRFGSDVVPSLTRLGIGYALAVVLGVAGGIALGRSALARRMTAPIIEFLRAVPPPALIPFAYLLLGVGDASKIFLIATVCVWPILLNAIDGVSGVEPTLLDTSRAYRTRRVDELRRVVLPAAAPQMLAGMRTSLSLALILMVISEMVASTNGIGYFVLQSQRTFAITEMWSGIVLLGLLGYLLNALFTAFEKRALAWHRGSRTAAR
jgi:ABC-type nitrate/sulfonate/bicarbonate transport system permease component